jgi:hypothetical protein
MDVRITGCLVGVFGAAVGCTVGNLFRSMKETEKTSYLTDEITAETGMNDNDNSWYGCDTSLNTLPRYDTGTLPINPKRQNKTIPFNHQATTRLHSLRRRRNISLKLNNNKKLFISVA